MTAIRAFALSVGLALSLPTLAEPAMACRLVEPQPIIPVYDIRNVAITVHWHQDYESLNAELTDAVGPHDPVLAWTQCAPPIEASGLTINPCVIHAIPPTQVEGDPRMETLGHEFLHTLIGNFHR